MQIALNGQPHTVSGDATVAALLQALDLSAKRLAVEINGEVLPRSAHASHRLQADDKVEIVQAIGGG